MQEVTIRKSKRSKYLRLTVHPGGRVVLSGPLRASQRSIEKFLRLHAGWIEKNVKKLAKLKPVSEKSFTRTQYLKNKEAARKLVKERLAHFNKLYGYKYNRVSITNPKTRWGSCSDKGNMSFSARIVLLPQELQDYIVVHELCHLKELNHSKDFWALVERAIPNYKELRKKLRNNV